MPVNRLGVLTCMAMAVAGCSLLRPLVVPAQTGKAELVVDQATFDGEKLTARVLLKVRDGDLSIQQHLGALQGLTIEDVTDCETGASVPFLEFVVVRSGDQPLVRILDGHWFGVETWFDLYDPKIAGKPPPDCIDATVVWWIPDPPPSTPRWVSATVRVVTKLPAVLDADGGAQTPLASPDSRDAPPTSSSPDAGPN